MQPIHVTCAIIEDQGRILAAQRSAQMHLPHKWEFPGGKVRDGESLEACLVREIQEELGLDVEVLVALEPVEHRYPDKHIILYPFVCRVEGGRVTPTEHERVEFFAVPQLESLDWAEADLPVLAQWLLFHRNNGLLPTRA